MKLNPHAKQYLIFSALQIFAVFSVMFLLETPTGPDKNLFPLVLLTKPLLIAGLGFGALLILSGLFVLNDYLLTRSTPVVGIGLSALVVCAFVVCMVAAAIHTGIVAPKELIGLYLKISVIAMALGAFVVFVVPSLLSKDAPKNE
jgi:Na+-transporting NADH:ubiquinone oxidoreductase subunit NqrB